MNLDQYQVQLKSLTQSIEVEGDPFEFNLIGLGEEVGETLGKLKRALRGEGFDRQAYLLELSDVLGYLALAAGSRDIAMREIDTLISLWEYVDDPYRYRYPSLSQIIKETKGLFTHISELMDDPMAFDRERSKWHLTRILFKIDCCATVVESSLEELMAINLQKLQDRLERNSSRVTDNLSYQSDSEVGDAGVGTLLGAGDCR
jgi:NTP pyrophosphatase (non-canonical NTP hydrolase)